MTFAKSNGHFTKCFEGQVHQVLYLYSREPRGTCTTFPGMDLILYLSGVRTLYAKGIFRELPFGSPLNLYGYCFWLYVDTCIGIGIGIGIVVGAGICIGIYVGVGIDIGVGIGSISQHLASGGIWAGSIWQHLGSSVTSGIIWQHLGAPGIIWRHLAAG